MVLAFSDSKGLIYTNEGAWSTISTSLRSSYITEAITLFLRVSKQKRPSLEARDWWFDWDNAATDTTAIMTNLMAAM
jgi:hypothetical protein